MSGGDVVREDEGLGHQREDLLALDEEPVVMPTDPLLPLVDPPLLIDIDPLTPDAPASALRIDIVPEFAYPDPLTMLTLPPAAPPVARCSTSARRKWCSPRCRFRSSNFRPS